MDDRRNDYTKIVQHLYMKGFSPSQIRHICIKILKLNPRIITAKVSMYVSKDWRAAAETRFFKEDIPKELQKLDLWNPKRK